MSIWNYAFVNNQLHQVEFKRTISTLSQTVFSNQVKQGGHHG